MAMTLAEELALVETAITDVLEKGQATGVADQTYRRADLKELRGWRADVLVRIDRADKGSRTVAEF